MIKEYLKKQTKRVVAEFAKEYYDIELDKSLTKSKMIDELFTHELREVKELPLECSVIESETRCESVDESDAIVVKELSDDVKKELEGVSANAPLGDENVTLVIKDEFKPKWMPTYRRGDELYQPVAHDVIHDWNIGRRDSHELKTIEYWVKRNGHLLVHDRLSNSFIYLR
ncbi:hypothetical protein [Vibrio phage XZ1]|uniref:Uncharacterized protein n=2 Tax=Schizotequatrovirus valkk3 TaxID=1914021 RepID=A0A140B3I3_9CAUD|nr:prohead protease inhibitor [Vibrio phage ValKK3]ALP47097.1 hypothetical protein phiGrn1_0108 [Vibrio phage phi-Grn1]ALP47480.1 hypothetical protein phiST2_0239 [Vibrio phage phi-ST2]QBX06098.1 hypothetical protein Va3_144 [Vibrio phage Va3]QNJ54723.1 hypothetical protein vBValMR10Z_183 [Vibrio phage vB_ValM_R10Z]QNJ55110.1 hypothetical protein vBValMR11Z_184 [Vibrio phage vB_ValM_R11Z]UOL51159.1 hypothetical protein [Vibrio phage XZ1]URQ03574.1 hypothetical protein PVA23_197 [Vibrio phage